MIILAADRTFCSLAILGFLSLVFLSELLSPASARYTAISPHHHPSEGSLVSTSHTYIRRELTYSSAILPVSKHHHEKERIRTWFADLAAGIGTGAVFGLLLSAWVGFLKHAIYDRPPILISGQTIFGDVFSGEDDLALLHTDEIKLLEMIGRGGCGEVYKSELPASNCRITVAIKKVNWPGMETDALCNENHKLLDKRLRQIRAEILTAGFLRHPNLVPLLAHVYQPNCHYLIYEFMPNGSLHDKLKAASQGAQKFSWTERYNVAREVAVGLEYLHFVHHIVHRDLKPANILLNGNMEARISDFGLAKEGPEPDGDGLTSNIAGTVGYIAPEYYQIMQFTEKCDVYSFGVILAVLVTGKFPSDCFFRTGEDTLPRWIRNVMRSNDPTRAIDGNLIGNGYESQMLLVLKIACFCTYDDPRQRPTMRDVRHMLSHIKH